MDVAPGTIVIWSDVACPWATLAVHRLHEARAAAGLAGLVCLEHRPFPLELFNERPTSRPVLDAEIPVVGALAPGFGWTPWQGDPWAYPGSVLLALEAVQAAAEQSPEAAEQLDLGLRRAFFAGSRPIGMRHVVLDVAGECAGVDAGALREALDGGRARRRVVEAKDRAEAAGVKGSPHVFLPDGSDHPNPGVAMHWEGTKPAGFPVVDEHDPGVYERLVRAAAGAG